jgi:hypothetical protein|tara:strand:+ start:296 stop:1030 length:735 start_codon:yes stop_codon:yes gene_type:complete
MAVQLIKIGNTANDGTGDDLREAFVKVNNNFNELDLRDDEQTTVTNLGTTGVGIYKEKINYDLKFKKLVAGTNVTLTATSNDITITTPDIGLQRLTVSAGSALLSSQVILDTPGTEAIQIYGGVGISTAIAGNTLTITNTAPSEVASDASPSLGGNLDGEGFNISNLGTIISTGVTANLTGNVTGLINGIDPATMSTYFNNLDAGAINTTVNNIIDFIVAQTDQDMGTITSPANTIVDFGSVAV